MEFAIFSPIVEKYSLNVSAIVLESETTFLPVIRLVIVLDLF